MAVLALASALTSSWSPALCAHPSPAPYLAAQPALPSICETASWRFKTGNCHLGICLVPRRPPLTQEPDVGDGDSPAHEEQEPRTLADLSSNEDLDLYLACDPGA